MTKYEAMMARTFEGVLALSKVKASQRPGQAFFNTLHELRPELAAKIIGTDDDPFYIDGNIDKCRWLFNEPLNLSPEEIAERKKVAAEVVAELDAKEGE